MQNIICKHILAETIENILAVANRKRDARLELISKIIGSRRAFFSLTEKGGNDDGSNERIYSEE